MHGGGRTTPKLTLLIPSGIFERAIRHAEKAGLPLERVCLDPGIGFGKDRQGYCSYRKASALVQGYPDRRAGRRVRSG